MRLFLIIVLALHSTTLVRVANGVQCFNCVSAETPGCGRYLDISLLTKFSTSSRSKREILDKLKTDDYYDLITNPAKESKNSTTTKNSTDSTIFSSYNSDSIENEMSAKEDYENFTLASKNSTLWKMLSQFNISDALKYDIAAIRQPSSYENLTAGIENSLGENYAIGDSLNNPQGRTDVSGEGSSWHFKKVLVDDAEGYDYPNEQKRSRPRLVVECRSDRCLTQRVPTKKGDVYVRTCDTSRVPSGQCHLVTGVLGARISVVCVCSGDLCNDNSGSANSKTTSDWMLFLTILLSAILIFSLSG